MTSMEQLRAESEAEKRLRAHARTAGVFAGATEKLEAAERTQHEEAERNDALAFLEVVDGVCSMLPAIAAAEVECDRRARELDAAAVAVDASFEQSMRRLQDPAAFGSSLDFDRQAERFQRDPRYAAVSERNAAATALEAARGRVRELRARRNELVERYPVLAELTDEQLGAIGPNKVRVPA